MLSNKQTLWKKRLLLLDTASLSDALDSLNLSRALSGIKSRLQGKKIAGPVFTVKYTSFEREKNKFYNAGNYIDNIPAGHVVFVDNEGRNDCTSWGNILSFKAIRNGIEGTVINGSVRDISEIRTMQYPLFSKHVFMVSGKNRVIIESVQKNLTIDGVEITPDDWLVGDDNGVLVIAEKHLEKVIGRAENIEQTEKNILDALSQGEALHLARERSGYSRPWENLN